MKSLAVAGHRMRRCRNPATGGVCAPSELVAAWAEDSADLPPEALGQMIQLEFLFTSDDVQNLAGWYIDDVLVTTPAPEAQ